MNSIDKLSEIFSKFPGIGPRQAKRFVYFLLSKNGNFTGELVDAVTNLKREITQCVECKRFYAKNGYKGEICTICGDETRDNSMLMVVPRDIDLEAVEKSGSFHGYYFVLGGVVPVLEKEPEKKIRLKDLENKIKKNSDLKEVVLAMNANTDGENTADFIKECLKEWCQGCPLTVTVLGRGLSTGAELEYADPETLKNAFLHRTN